MEFDKDVHSLVEQLVAKYTKSGQDIKAYLEGLLHANYLNYWDYIEVDTLLTLQKPRTAVPDEMIFIIYHQITELYFKLTLHEMEQIGSQVETMSAAFFTERVKRMNAYFRNLTHSFEIMVEGMDHKQFLKYRMSLLPASGFQSAQYRKIEICATDMVNLVDKDYRNKITFASSIYDQFDHIYWKAGATELATGKKTLTLTQFEEKYSRELQDLAHEYATKNLWAVFQSLKSEDKQDAALREQLRQFDVNVNVNWPLQHYKSAVRYLHKNPEDIAATGGTNWQKYLPPRFQKRVFYPELWTDLEKEEWGKQGIIDLLTKK